MQAFSDLLDKLYFTSSHLEKSVIIRDYLETTPDTDRGWAIAAIAGELSFDLFKRTLIRDLIKARIDPVLFELSYDYVGEMSETVALLWPPSDKRVRLNRLPGLSEVIERFTRSDKDEMQEFLVTLLDNMDAKQRWALTKLGTRGLRVGVSARSLKKILAEYGNKDVNEIEAVWHGVDPPYTQLFQWLEGQADKPALGDRVLFHPVMLSHPLEEADLHEITPDDFAAEWKYDGIRVQLVSKAQGAALFSRTGDDISHAFPDLMEAITLHGVLDGELLVLDDAGRVAPFNHLQQRLNRKKPTKKLMRQHPAALMIYDVLELENASVIDCALTKRRQKLEAWFEECISRPVSLQEASGVSTPNTCPPVCDEDKGEPKQAVLPRFFLSEQLTFSCIEELHALREQADRSEGNHIEGLMLKRKDAPYIPGRPKGQWYKWKRDPLLVDAVMMYAQRGHGKRSSFYSDYTFGLWHGKDILPIGKAYAGFTDAELKALDKWVRNHTINRFGPVREVEKQLVLEVAFDSVHASPRHKSGLALRFPRIHRIRWDKPAAEADHLTQLRALV